MTIRDEDIRAIATAVEMLENRELARFRLRRDGETIFSAEMVGDRLAIDPNVMPLEIAERLVGRNILGPTGSSTHSPPESNAPATGTESSRSNAETGEPRKVPA